MALWNPWVELEITQNAARHGKLLAALQESGIPCREKVQSAGHNDRRMGQVGEHSAYGFLYQVYVRKKDLEQARYLARRLAQNKG